MFKFKRHHTVKNTAVMTWKTLRDIFRPLRKVKSEKIVIKEDEMRVWRIGHATVLINFFGTTILTDPVLVKWIPYPRRITDIPYKVEDLPDIDIVAVSHAHLDHLNKPTLKRLGKKSKNIIIPKNCSDLVSKYEFDNTIELSWLSSHSIDGVTVYSIKPLHWGQRFPWEFKDRGYNAYVLEKKGKNIYFSGDSGYGEFYEHVGHRHDIDVAIMGIGSYYPDPYLRNHQNPEQAVDASVDIKADYIIPMHYEDFRLTVVPILEPIHRFKRAAEEKGVIDQVRILSNGKSWALHHEDSNI
jgi:L-ascorbate metabolism protein UlaG (beta-lactamase superfamily)